MTLIFNFYCSVTEHHALKAKDTIAVRNGDTLFLRLETVHNVLRNYGKQVYKPFYEQTDKGLSKFYSILRYLVSFKLFKINFLFLYADTFSIAF